MPTLPLKLVFAAAFPLALSAADPRGPGEAWSNTALGLFPDAHGEFSRASLKQPSDREARLGEALTLLQLQPRTDARLNRTTDILNGLLSTKTGDEIDANARYFLARLEHIHRSPPDPAAAIAHYERLIADHPDHPLAGQALVKLSLLKIYGAQDSALRAAAFADFSARAPSLPTTDSAARRDLHLVLGEAALRFHFGEQAALDHFVAALAAGIQLRPVRADTLVRIGELASSLGQPDLARRHYQLFLDEFARDPRRLAVSQHLVALDASVPTP